MSYYKMTETENHVAVIGIKSGSVQRYYTDSLDDAMAKANEMRAEGYTVIFRGKYYQ